jgi:hypothetical protein
MQTIASLTAGEIVMDNSGSILIGAAADGLTRPAATKVPAAATLQEAVFSSPVSTESFSTIQVAPQEEPALILPAPSVFGPGQLGFLAAVDEQADPFDSINQVTPIPEPPTWSAAALLLGAVTRRAGKRRHTLQPPSPAS